MRIWQHARTCSVSSHEINLVENFKPKFSKSYHVPKSHQSKICPDHMLTSLSCHDHISRSHNVFCDVKDNGVSLKLPKCKFVKPEVNFISHVIESETRSSLLNKELSVKDT